MFLLFSRLKHFSTDLKAKGLYPVVFSVGFCCCFFFLINRLPNNENNKIQTDSSVRKV